MSELPSALLPYQQRWIADAAPFKIAEKGRRTGLTWAEAADDVLIAAAAKSAGGQNVYYLGTDKEMTEEYIDACGMWAKQFKRIQRHGDGAIALFLANRALSSEVVPMEFESSGARSSYRDLEDVRKLNEDRGYGSVSGGNDFRGW